MKLIPLTQGKFAIVDDEDYDLVSRFKWQCAKTGKTGRLYARRYERVGVNRRRPVWMHRFVKGETSGKVDHRNGDSLDNRRSNLRMADSVTNGQNRKIQKHSTPYKGVSFFKAGGNYTAKIAVNGKDIHLGYFDCPMAAVRAYDSAAITHFGEFARTNQQMGVL